MPGVRIGGRTGLLAAGFIATHLLGSTAAGAAVDLATPLAVAACALLPRPAAIAAAVASALLAALALALRGESGSVFVIAAAAQALCVSLGAGLLRVSGSVARRYDGPSACMRFLVLGAALPALAGALLRSGDGIVAAQALLPALPVALATLGAWSDLIEDWIRAEGHGTDAAGGARPRGWLLPSSLTGLGASLALSTGYDPAPWLLAGLTVGALRHGPRVVGAQAGIAMGIAAIALVFGLPDTTAGGAEPGRAENLHMALAVAVPLLFATARRPSGRGVQDDGAMATIASLAEARAHARRMTHLAHHDPLTGLPNRRLLLARLGKALRDAQTSRQRVALLFIDLDGFKAINDGHGHALGDALLRAVAQRLRARVRAGDTVCRLAGDEFVVLLPSIADREAAMEVATLLRAALARPFALRGRVLRVGFSGGMAIAPEDGTRAETLLERADAAMYEAKRRGRDAAAAGVPH